MATCQRQSRLVPLGAFASALRAALPSIEQVEPLTINGAGLPVGLSEQLWQLVYSLDVVENEAKIVAATKTLHQLLPDLVPPIDRVYTRTFFDFYNPEFGDSRQPTVFRAMYGHLAEIAREVCPEQYGTSTGWRTSRTKIVREMAEPGVLSCADDVLHAGRGTGGVGLGALPRHPLVAAGRSVAKREQRQLPTVSNRDSWVPGWGHLRRAKTRIVLGQP
jgi:hypothetical protein